jgi:hypothetical protein
MLIFFVSFRNTNVHACCILRYVVPSNTRMTKLIAGKNLVLLTPFQRSDDHALDQDLLDSAFASPGRRTSQIGRRKSVGSIEFTSSPPSGGRDLNLANSPPFGAKELLRGQPTDSMLLSITDSTPRPRTESALVAPVVPSEPLVQRSSLHPKVAIAPKGLRAHAIAQSKASGGSPTTPSRSSSGSLRLKD